MRILVADDDPIQSALLRHVLVGLGHEPVFVTNGSSAVAALTSPGAPPMAILDWMMPGMEGPDVCREIRRRGAQYTYVILLTARESRRDMLTALEAGADDFLTKPFDVIELRARLQSGERVVTLQEGLLAAHETLRQQATRDDLTGFFNRRVLMERLDVELHRARHEQRPVAVAMADLDNFKQINDNYGHAAGDEVLRQVSERIRTQVRDYDLVGRYGGEEFVLVFPGCDVSAAGNAAERIRAAIGDRPFLVSGISQHVTISLGLAWTNPLELDGPALVQSADEALYRAKAAGRNRVER